MAENSNMAPRKPNVFSFYEKQTLYLDFMYKIFSTQPLFFLSHPLKHSLLTILTP
jgi:hypothetical protein